MYGIFGIGIGIGVVIIIVHRATFTTIKAQYLSAFGAGHVCWSVEQYL